MTEDWAAVAKAINERVSQLGWRQRELAERSHVSLATVRELQNRTVERRRSVRTLESLSVALGWHPSHLDAVLRGHTPPEPTGLLSDEALSSRLDRLEQHLVGLNEHLVEISDRLENMNGELATVIRHIGPKR